MTAISISFVTAAFLGGVAVTWLLREREVSMVRAAAAGEKARAGELAMQLAQSEANLSGCQAALSSARTRLEAEHDAHERERAGIETNMLAQFQTLAQQALGSVTSSFLELATAKLGTERETIAGSLMTRVEQIKGIVGPVHDEFTKFRQAVNLLQKNSSEDLGALKNSLEQVVRLQAELQEAVRTTNDSTGQLRNALQNPHVAGSWGEICLDRIVELAGMVEHCDFELQTGMRSLEGSGERPDLTIHLTGGLRIPVDAKTSAANYIRAASETDEEERKRLLKQSAQDLKSRVTELRGRSYDRIEGYAGMTFLFVPNESMLSAALAQEPNMVEEALRYGIVLCSPLLLMCYLRAFANGWRIQKQQENADEVARRGKMLHDRLQKFFLSLAKVGKYLNHTVEKFNDSVGKMENLLVPGRELSKLLGLTNEMRRVNDVDATARDLPFAEVEDVGHALASAEV
jgi:DNA recombination protein RmuC